MVDLFVGLLHVNIMNGESHMPDIKFYCWEIYFVAHSTCTLLHCEIQNADPKVRTFFRFTDFSFVCLFRAFHIRQCFQSDITDNFSLYVVTMNWMTSAKNRIQRSKKKKEDNLRMIASCKLAPQHYGAQCKKSVILHDFSGREPLHDTTQSVLRNNGQSNDGKYF